MHIRDLIFVSLEMKRAFVVNVRYIATKDMKVKIKDVMKFSGPRLIIYSPMQFIKHIFE